ncbi:hypothetical protein EXU57_20155 [Segetibacter sp. 3557_3]|uniref:hypothetical protein n=1 Tax=Segetibacter sp. 3557_3 TaxID=2547429 RepID=UPI0010590AFF|nr:hypothetical protein [Segetibacter sp. 3557_3]TDH21256.1 hypothetical protein EXU57_20155 [Segetibacter sp. 3557_3]
MVEVFKTNVQKRAIANILIDEIHRSFPAYRASFDLDDCDKILRVECRSHPVQANELIILLKDFGFQAEVLPDDPPATWKQLSAAYPLFQN